jgi:hypothetical protein
MAPALAIAPIAACSEYAVWLYVVQWALKETSEHCERGSQPLKAVHERVSLLSRG